MVACLISLVAVISPPPEALWYRVDRHSLRQLIAYSTLDPESENGRLAREQTLQLLGDAPAESLGGLELIAPLVPWLTGSQASSQTGLSAQQRQAIAPWSKQLGNRKLPGFGITTVEQLKALKPEEVDLARGLLLEQWGTSADALERIAAYEGLLDWMALEVLAKVGREADGPTMIAAVNHLLFEQMHIRFPPHRLAESGIDAFTALPLVVDSRRGVCLGVSCLYLCLAQRLNLPLEIVTPPGHIVLRHYHGDRMITIETTAGGVDMPEEKYLNVNTRHLRRRNMKEVVGLALCNEAAAHWGQKDVKGASELYRRASAYMPHDPFVAQFLGASLLGTGERREGRQWLQEAVDHREDDQIHPPPLAEDLLAGYADAAAVSVVFAPTESTNSSLEKHREELEKLVRTWPRFRIGWMSLAVTHLQLHRPREATEALEHLKALDPEDPMVAFYLAALNGQRNDLPKAWKELERAQSITARHNYHPKALRMLHAQLQQLSPKAS